MAHKETEETNSLHLKLKKLPLGDKVTALNALKGYIEDDRNVIEENKKELEQQLALIPKQ